MPINIWGITDLSPIRDERKPTEGLLLIKEERLRFPGASTNVPFPCSLYKMPLFTRSSKAFRTVSLLTPNLEAKPHSEDIF